MPDENKTVMVLLGVDERYTKNISIPKKIENYKSLWQIKIQENIAKHLGASADIEEINGITKRIVDNFDRESAESFANALNLLENDNTNYQELVDYVLAQYKYLNNKIIEVDDKFWMEEKEPMQFFANSLVYKTVMLAHNVLSNISKVPDKNELKKELKRLVDKDEKDRELEYAKFGFFVSLEPLFIVSIIHAYVHKRISFLLKYENLLNRFYYFGIELYPDTYLETVRKNAREPDYESYDNFVEALKSNPL